MNTLCQNIHRVVDLNVHVITNCRKILSLVRDQSTVLGLDLVRGASLAVKPPRDDNAVAINIVLVCFVATVLEGDRDFRSSGVYELAPKTSK